MAAIKINPSTPRVTENCQLDLPRVHQFYVLFRNNLPVEPVTLIHDRKTGRYYFVNGHHRAYAAYVAGIQEIGAVILQTDYDVKECQRGKAKAHSTHANLLSDCISGFSLGRDELGLENIGDYSSIQRVTGLDSRKMIHIISLNPTIDRCAYAHTEVPGGKGFNVARNLMQLGYDDICTYGFAGGKTGNLLARLVNAQKIPFYLISILDRTITVEITGATTRQRLDAENPEARFTELDDLESRLQGAVKQGDIVVFAGSLPRNVRPSLFNEWIRRFNQNATTVFDSSEVEPFRLAVDASPRIIKPNREEVLTYLGKADLSVADFAQEAANLIAAKGIGTILVSLDKDGAVLVTQEGAYHSPAIHGDVVCSTGGGDALLAGYLAASAQGNANKDSLRLAMATARSHISHAGNLGAKKEEVDEILKKVMVKKLF